MAEGSSRYAHDLAIAAVSNAKTYDPGEYSLAISRSGQKLTRGSATHSLEHSLMLWPRRGSRATCSHRGRM